MRRALRTTGSLCLAALPAVSAAAEHAHEEHATDPMLLVFHAFGLVVLIGVLVYYARAPIQAFLADRSDSLRRQLDASRVALQRAREENDRLRARLERVVEENESAVRSAAEQAEQEKERALERARQSAERVREEARRAADQEILRARGALQEEAARIATELAGEILRQELTPDDDRRMLADFVTRAGGDS
jgi:F-type H+-transporting ATPase subunit b